MGVAPPGTLALGVAPPGTLARSARWGGFALSSQYLSSGNYLCSRYRHK